LRRFPLRVRPGELESAFFALEPLFSQMMAIPYDLRIPAFSAIHLLSSPFVMTAYHNIIP
jgi:hypothetical protein